MSVRIRNVAWLGAVAGLALSLWLQSPERPAQAMPNFAQALGVDCSVCHTLVPQLNAYGRYVQRSMYSVLDQKTLEKAVPAFFEFIPSYSTQDPNFPHQVQLGNVNIHTDGGIGSDVTFHGQLWPYQGNAPGGLDTLWASYNHLANDTAHLVVGKMPVPGPSFFSQWADLAPFAAPEITVGEHAYQMDNNRWGTKLSYTPTTFVAEVGWYGANTDLNGASDFSNDTDKSVQWHAAWARPDKPLEIGAYGTTGTWPLTEGGVDRYSASAVYAQLDPTHNLPGAMAIYQFGNDLNSGAGIPAHSTAEEFEIYWPPFKSEKILLGVREDITNDGLGNVTRSGNIDLNFRIARYVHATLEAGLAGNNTPAWNSQILWSQPLGPTPK
jgi:hypothetical protein